MLRNIIGPVFNFRNCAFFVGFCLFFKNPLLSAGRMSFSKIKKNKKKQKKMDQSLTLKRAKIGPVFNYIYIYIYLYTHTIFSTSCPSYLVCVVLSSVLALLN